jgi:hypothetical protein
MNGGYSRKWNPSDIAYLSVAHLVGGDFVAFIKAPYFAVLVGKRHCQRVIAVGKYWLQSELVSITVVDIQPPYTADINIALFIFGKTIPLLQVSTAFKILIEMVHFHRVAIITINRIIAGNPHKAMAIFKPKIVGALRQTIILRESPGSEIDIERLPLSRLD